MYGMVVVVVVLQCSDLLIVLGICFDDWVIGKFDLFVLEVKVIYVDIDLVEIGKNCYVDVFIVGDVKVVIIELIVMLCYYYIFGIIEMVDWWVYLNGVCKIYLLSYGLQSDGSLSLEYVIEKFGEIVGLDVVFVVGVGQYQMWVVQFIRYEKLCSWLNFGGLGIMGFVILVVMGVKIVFFGIEVWVIDGDGCFQMINQELVICVVEGILVKVVLINNGNLGMVWQWQSLFYVEWYLQIDLVIYLYCIFDFVKLVEVLGCVGLWCEWEEDVVDVINQVWVINDCLVVIDFIVGVDV